MDIDRSRFLILVSAIAAATACTTKSDSSGTGGGGGGSTATTTTTATGAGGAGGETGTGGAGGATGAGGADCDNSQGTPAACASACEGFDACSMIVGDLKPGVGVNVVACLNALDPAVCAQPDIDTCLQTGLAAACADAAADADCAALAAPCGASSEDPAWQSECHSLVDGLTQDARASVLSCASEGGGCDPSVGGSLYACVQGLTYF